VADEQSTFRDYLAAWIPPWMGPVGRELGVRLGLILDSVAQGAIEAVKVRLTRYAPEDALPYLGWERGIRRGPGESSSSYAPRLQTAHTQWSKADSDLGIIDALAAIGITARIFRNYDIDWDGHPGKVEPYWARMWVVIDPPHPFTAPFKWGSGAKWGSGGQWGATGSKDLVAFIRNEVKKWSGSHVLIPKIIIVVKPELWGGGFKWGAGKKWGGKAAQVEGW
jgi:hypothetical protein